jgi:starch phosphorylase
MNVARDPVCGMTVLKDKSLKGNDGGHPVYFCSPFCKTSFEREPARYGPRLFVDATREAMDRTKIAYFSMEVALGSDMHTYSGGLGVLAGDTLKSAADLRVPMVGITLLHREGYFRQELDGQGRQREGPAGWDPAPFLAPLSATVEIEIEGRAVRLTGWEYQVLGMGGFVVPVIFMDANMVDNSDYDRSLTGRLYGGDERYRLAQECVLGIGGVRILRELGYGAIERYHMNEGHSSLLVLELLRRRRLERTDDWDFEGVRKQCVFTTHTPVAAGHDQFAYDLVERVVGEPFPMEIVRMLGGQDRLNMTLLGFNLSHFVNGVALRHEEVSRKMFPAYLIQHVTNGVHSWTWTCEAFRDLYDRHVPGWSNDPAMLRHVLSVSKDELWEAHKTAKAHLVAEVQASTGRSLSAENLTIGFGRRATSYKRADLVFSDLDRLREVVRRRGTVQFVFAGKAHPRDEPGKELIARIVRAARDLGEEVPVVYLAEYDMRLAKVLVSGCDLWLNTPEPPLEASGTSGMKAAHNGVPSLSSLDGWWVEGCVEGLTGWSLGGRSSEGGSGAIRQRDAEDLYRKLDEVILPLFYGNRAQWVEVMRHAIALNAAYFNTHRMVQQYVTNAYVG